MKAKLRKLHVVFICIVSFLLVLAIALSIAANIPALQSIAFTYLGRGEATPVQLEGTENWDTNYYEPQFSTKEETVKNGEAVTRELCEEGFVLLKNQDGALPLDAGETISLIGRGAVDPLYGGSGSGNVDVSKAASPYSGIEQAGFSMDDASYDYFMKEKDNYKRCAIVMDKYEQSQWLIGEVANDGSGVHPFTVNGESVAVYVISRAGGEGWDLSSDLLRDAKESAAFADAVKSGTAKAEYETYVPGQHQLELSTYEKNWLKFCEDNYDKTIVIINSSNVMELGELEADAGVDAILWVGGPGSTGFDALGNILSGKVNPSGRTVDIYPADFTKDPTFVNTAAINQYSDIGAGDVAAGDNSIAAAFTTQYEEGIYLGYRYYETAAEEGFIDYDEAVVYPFGYGLSYTEFSYGDPSWSVSGNVITASVTVTNEGDVAGKDVVQLYYSAPYTEGGIEKSSVVLGGFAKTALIEPGGTDTVTITLDRDEMASYDYKGIKIEGGGYVLEEGDYILSLRSDSHTLLPGDDMTYTYEVGSDVFYDEVTTVADGEILFEKQPAVNRFSDVSAIFKDTPTAGYALPMSRADFAGTFPTAPTADDLLAKQITLTYEEDGETVSKTIADFLKPFDPATDLIDADAEMPTMGASNGIVLSSMRGIGYGEAIWDDFLDQLTEADYTDLAPTALASNAFNTPEIESLGKSRTQDFDGPQGFTSLFGSTGCCAYCSEVVIASTWNLELAYEMGNAIGEESIINGYNGWYGPAMNIHRSPFSGRNFEYYSEDAFLSGVMGAAVVEGAADMGCYAYIKHFALNDTEVKRTTNLCTWATEQTIREIYLKPFQYVVENTSTEMKYISDDQGTVSTVTMPGLKAIMSSFNRIGGTWAGGSYALMTEVLRGEWAFRGVASSDFNLYGYMPADQGLRAGTDMQLTFSKAFADTESATSRQAMRTAYKNMCYTVANSNLLQGVAPGASIVYGLAWWQAAIIAFDVVVGVLAVACAVFIVIDLRRRNK